MIVMQLYSVRITFFVVAISTKNAMSVLTPADK